MISVSGLLRRLSRIRWNECSNFIYGMSKSSVLGVRALYWKEIIPVKDFKINFKRYSRAPISYTKTSSWSVRTSQYRCVYGFLHKMSGFLSLKCKDPSV
jgi:hypothetical protein